MDHVFVVMGRTGEYADTEEWLVRAWQQKADADAMVARLNAWCAEHKLAEMEMPLPPRQRPRQIQVQREVWDGAKRPPEDPRFSCQFSTGTIYCVTEVPFGPVSAEPSLPPPDAIIATLDAAVRCCVAALAAGRPPELTSADRSQCHALGLLILKRRLTDAEWHARTNGRGERWPEVKATPDVLRVWNAHPSPEEVTALETLGWTAPDGDESSEANAWTFYP